MAGLRRCLKNIADTKQREIIRSLLEIDIGPDYLSATADAIDSLKEHISELEATRADVIAQIDRHLGGEQVKESAATLPKTEAKATLPSVKEKLTTEPTATESPKSEVDAHQDFMVALQDGKTSVDEMKSQFERVVTNRAAITEELSSKTKDELLSMLGGMMSSRMKNEKKAEIIRSVYDGMLKDFHISGDSLSYVIGGGDMHASMVTQIRKSVEKTTPEQVEKYAAKIAKQRDERKAYHASVIGSVKDPKTLEDFERFVAIKGRAGLTPEQLAQFEQLSAEKTRGERASRKSARQDSTLRAPGEAVGTSEIIKTKHTKLGHDLWQFELDKRVSPEEFKTMAEQARSLGGNYSSYRGNGAIPGWQFRSEDSAKAFKALVAGDATAAKDVMQARRDAFSDDRSQTAVERLTEMADKLDEGADASLSQSRKENTQRRAGQAANAVATANYQKAISATMRNLAAAITEGKTKFLDRVRQKVQVEMLDRFVRQAQLSELRSKYSEYSAQERHKGEMPTRETIAHAKFPQYTAYRSDLAALGRQMQSHEGLKLIGNRILSVADDVSKEYAKFAKENLFKVSAFRDKVGIRPAFPTRAGAEAAIDASGYNGKAISLQVKRGEHTIILSPSEAAKRGIWNGDDDKRITLADEFGAEIVEKAGRRKLSVPHYFETVHEQRKRLDGMGIETPAEFRSALREFVALREAPKVPDKIKEMERAMIGRKNDGLDFFPTPANVADRMVEAAGIEEGMSVLEPSAGMGHIAERIREAGVDPDVIELASDRRSLLEAKGFNLVGADFMETTGSYDRVVMNPPFSDRRDIAHVQHAYDLLAPGGRLVAIMGEGSFFGSDKKAVAFREWLEQHNGTDEKLDEGSFKDSSLPVTTGANARMVVIDKPADAKFSKGEKSTGLTPAEATTQLSNLIGSRSAQALIESGRVVLVENEGGMPNGADKFSLSDNIKKSVNDMMLADADLHLERLKSSLNEAFRTEKQITRLHERAVERGHIDSIRERKKDVATIQSKIEDLQIEVKVAEETYKKLLNKNLPLFSKNEQTLGATTRDGKMYLNLSALDKDSFAGVALHEGLHSVLKATIGEADYARLMQRMDNLRKIFKNGTGEVGKFFKKGMAAIPADTKPEHVAEELAAYALQEYVNAPRSLPQSILKFVKDLISAIKVGLMRSLPEGSKLRGKLLDSATEADLARLAIVGLRRAAKGVEASVGDGVMASKRTTDQTETWKNAKTISRESVLSANKFGLQEAKSGNVTYASWYSPEHAAAYNYGIEGVDLSSQPTVTGWRRGAAKFGGISRNYRDDISEGGLSMMSVNGSDPGFSEMFMGDRAKKEYTGILLPKKGSDGEPLIIPYGGENIDVSSDIRYSKSKTADKGDITDAVTDEGKKKLRKGYVHYVDKLIDSIDHWTSPMSALPQAAKMENLRNLAQGDAAKWDETAATIHKIFNKASQEDQKAIYDYLTTKGAALEKISAPMRQEAVRVKAAITHVGKILVEKGVIPEESRQKYEDAYLPQVYFAYLLGDNAILHTGGGKKISEQGYAKARKYVDKTTDREIRDVFLGEIKDPGYLAARAIAIPMRDLALINWLEQISANPEWTLPDQMVEWKNPLADKDTKPKKVTPFWLKSQATSLRKRAASYQEDAHKKAAYKLADSMDEQANKVLEGIGADKDAVPDGYKQMPDSPRYGALRGLIVRKAIYDDIAGISDTIPQDAPWIERFLGYGGTGTKITQVWKWAKVAANPPGQVRNFISNMIMLNLSGMRPDRVVKYFTKAVGEIHGKGKYYKMSRKHGMNVSTFAASEFLNIEKQLVELERQSKEGFGMHSFKYMGAMLMDKTGKMYQWSESVAKLMKMMHEIEVNKLTEEQAVHESNKWTFDYTEVNPTIRYLRNAPIGAPFVTYATKVLPRLLEVATKHPLRLLPYAAVIMGIPMAIASMYGVDDDEFDKLKTALPEWLEKRGNAIPMPYKDEQGRWQFVDIGYFLPWSQYWGLAKSVGRGEPGDFMSQTGALAGPFPSVIAAVTTGKDPFTDREIINEFDPAEKKFVALMQYTYGLMMPPWLVGVPVAGVQPTFKGFAGHAYDALTNHVDKYGDPTSTAGQAALRLFGVNTYAIDPSRTRAERVKRMMFEISQVKSRMKKMATDRNLDAEDRKAVIEQYREEIAARQKKLQEYSKESAINPKLMQ